MMVHSFWIQYVIMDLSDRARDSKKISVTSHLGKSIGHVHCVACMEKHRLSANRVEIY